MTSYESLSCLSIVHNMLSILSCGSRHVGVGPVYVRLALRGGVYMGCETGKWGMGGGAFKPLSVVFISLY